MSELKRNFICFPKPFVEGEVLSFEQTFSLSSDVKRATLTVTALGMYVAVLNAVKVGDSQLAPGYTYYPRDLFYQSFDVTDMLTTGGNRLQVLLGQGWYCGRFTFENKCGIYGERPAAAWILTVESADGGIREYVSDEQTDVRTSRYLYAGLYDGESVDENAAGVYLGKAQRFQGAVPENLTRSFISVVLQEQLLPVSSKRVNGKTIVDFGQNFAGVIVIDSARLPDGEKLIVRHAEVLKSDGSLYTDNLRKAKAAITYVKRVNETYIPQFTYMGFRYIEVEGLYTDGLISARAIYSQMRRTGEFFCQNALLQKLYDNQVWGQKSNYVDIPTDCPQRDERMGYTGDGQVFATTGCYNFDAESFWAKFLKDMRFSQMDNSEGYVAPTIPAQGKGGVGFMNMLGWGTAICRIPKILAEVYGADCYLKEYYDCMKLHVECQIRHLKGNLWLGLNLGDWLTYGKSMGRMVLCNNAVSNAFVIHDLGVVANTAKLLGRQEDWRRYSAQLELSAKAYLKRFVATDGRVKPDYQGAYIMALAYVIPQGELRKKVLSRLAAKVRKEGMRTGFFSTEHILPLLVEANEVGLAYDVLLNEQCPGWLYQVKCGATTAWERWDALKPDGTVNDVKVTKDNMVSFNHYAFGSVGSFYYQYILGIKPQKPGFAEALVQPCFDRRLGDVEGSLITRHGKIEVSWRYENDDVRLTLDTPVKTVVKLPDASGCSVQAGRHEFVCKGE